MSYLQSDSLSCQFFIALPDILGIQSDDVMLESIHQYLGLPSPAMKPCIDKQQYIGRRNRCQNVDEYGEAVARAQIQGRNFLRAHN